MSCCPEFRSAVAPDSNIAPMPIGLPVETIGYQVVDHPVPLPPESRTAFDLPFQAGLHLALKDGVESNVTLRHRPDVERIHRGHAA